MSADGQVTVANAKRTHNYSINGDPGGVLTLADAIKVFTGKPAKELDLKKNNVTFSGQDITDPKQLDQDLRGGDVVLILSSQLASGGYKGAA